MGALVAFKGVPTLEEPFTWPIRGWAGILGTILLGVSPRAGMVRSLGLICLWMSGLFVDTNPILFILGSVILIVGIAVAQWGSTEAKAAPADEGPDVLPLVD
jgi:hypothetical protein